MRFLPHPPSPRSAWWLVLAIGALGLGGVAACRPEIGDKCILSTDCSTRGDRLCDTSQPDGYCTVFNCVRDGCPDEAMCILFNANVPGCGYDDRAGKYGSRAARAFCMARCVNNDDCRGGYVCADPLSAPYNGRSLDSAPGGKACLVPSDVADAGAPLYTPNPTVCGPVGPTVDPYDASAPSIADGGTDAGPLLVDAGGPGADAGDAGDAGDGGDGGI